MSYCPYIEDVEKQCILNSFLMLTTLLSYSSSQLAHMIFRTLLLIRRMGNIAAKMKILDIANKMKRLVTHSGTDREKNSVCLIYGY